MLVLSARAHRAPTFNSLTISRRPARARKLVSDPLDHSGRISSPSNFGFIQKILQINATSKTLTNYSTYHFLQKIFQAERKVCFASWSKLPYDVGPARVFLGKADVWFRLFRPCIAGQGQSCHARGEELVRGALGPFIK